MPARTCLALGLVVVSPGSANISTNDCKGSATHDEREAEFRTDCVSSGKVVHVAHAGLFIYVLDHTYAVIRSSPWFSINSARKQVLHPR